MLKDLLQEVKIDGLYDGWGVCLSWLFALADYMSDQGLDIPSEWGYIQGMGGSDQCCYEYQTLEEFDPDPETLVRLGAILWRYRSKLIQAEKFY